MAKERETAVVWVLGPPSVGKRHLCEKLKSDLANRACEIEVLYWENILKRNQSPNNPMQFHKNISDSDIVVAMKCALSLLARRKLQCILVSNFPLNLNQALMMENQLKVVDLILSLDMEPNSFLRRAAISGHRQVKPQEILRKLSEYYQTTDPILFRYRDRVVHVNADLGLEEMVVSVREVLRQMGLISFRERTVSTLVALRRSTT